MRWTVALLLIGACKKKTTEPEPVVVDDSDELPAFDPLDDGVDGIREGCGEDALVMPDGGQPRLERTVTWVATDDYGAVARPIFVDLPDDTTGLSISVDAGLTKAGLGWATLDGRVLLDGTGTYEYDHLVRPNGMRGGRGQGVDSADTWTTGWTGDTGDTSVDEQTSWDFGWGPFFHSPDVAGTLVMPMNGDTMPRGGCLAFLPVAPSAEAGTRGTVHVLASRLPETADYLDINVVIARGAGIRTEQVATALDRMFEIYAGGGGPRMGSVGWFEVELSGGPRPQLGAQGLQELRSTVLADVDPRALSLFFIADFGGDSGTLGIAAGIPGPIGLAGTAGSGVVMSVEGHLDGSGTTLDLITLGETMAHEAGHQMGLFHTSESGGDSHDVIDDTPRCVAPRDDADGDGEVTAEECRERDGTNFMFWTAGDVRQDQMSAGQAFVLVRSPITHGDAP